jgi:hypothetical protein
MKINKEECKGCKSLMHITEDGWLECHFTDNLVDPNILRIKINNERVSELDSEISDIIVRMLELRNEKVLLMHEVLHAQTQLIRKARLKNE